MDVHIDHLDQLLIALADKTNLPIDTRGLKDMSEAVGLSEKYIYEYIFRKKEKARAVQKATISVQSAKLDVMARFVGYKNYPAFVHQLTHPIDPVLRSLTGSYYSYVRRNDDEGFIMRSPVRIHESSGKMMWELKGPMRTYSGEVKLRHGCLFILMEESAGKQIHHVYKIGTRQTPDVLQGIFSGVSTNFDPIGGRTVLVRSSLPFGELLGKEATQKAFSRSAEPAEKAISTYLKLYSKNNLKINRVVKYGEIDLLKE